MADNQTAKTWLFVMLCGFELLSMAALFIWFIHGVNARPYMPLGMLLFASYCGTSIA